MCGGLFRLLPVRLSGRRHHVALRIAPARRRGPKRARLRQNRSDDLPYFRNHIPIAAESQEIHPDCLLATGLRPDLNQLESNRENHEKAKKREKSKTSSTRRVKSKTSSKRVGGKSKTRKQIKAKPRTKSKKSILPKTPKLKQVAKEAAVAAGLAAVGTALSAMKPQQKG